MRLDDLFEKRYLSFAKRALKPATLAEYTRIARKLILPKLGARSIANLTFDDAEQLHSGIEAPVQANRALAVLSAILGYAVERKLLAGNPARGIRRNKEKGKEFFYTPAQCRAILKTLLSWEDIRGKYLALALLTGCRPGELIESGPSWRHGSVLRTPDGKTGARTIYLPPAASEILDSLPAGQRYFPERMDLRRAWDRVQKEANVPNARIYDLRHTFASAALASGESLAVIGQMLGHRKYQTTLRYAHLAPDVGLDAAARTAERMMKK